MKRLLFLTFAACFVPLMARADCPIPCPTTCYYVDNVAGNNANTGTSPSAAWKNLFTVNTGPGGGYLASAYVCFKRGDTWFGHLRFVGSGRATGDTITTADGVPGAPFTIDAYGSGTTPPTINAEFSIPSSTPWTHLSGNIYFVGTNSLLPEGKPFRIDMVKIGSVWGVCRGGNVALYCTSTGGTAALAHDRDFYYDGSTGNLYLYDDIGANPVTDFGAVVPVLDGAIQLLDLDGINYVQVQHLRLLNQSWYGIEYRGTADHLVIANVYADTEVPFNFHGTGFFVHPTNAASDISLLNTDAHRGYNGYDFAGIASATLTNCKAYYNRSVGLLDEVGNAVTYDYCHFYGNSVKSPAALDVIGGVPGTHNIAANTAPNIQNWHLYTPRFTMTFQPIGAAFGAENTLNSQLAPLGGAPLSIGVATNFPYTATLVAQLQSWVTLGYDLNSMGLSNVSYQNAPSLTVHYTGSGSAASLTIAAHIFTVTVTGASDSVSYDLSNASFQTVQQVEFALRQTGKFTAVLPQPCSACSWLSASAMLSKDLADVSSLDLKSAPQTLNFDVTRFLPDELAGSKSWLQANLTGLGSTFVYLYPGTLFDGSTESYPVSAGFQGARGAISMTPGADALAGASDAVASAGLDKQGLIAFSMAGWGSLTPTQLKSTIEAAVEKSAVWGVPYLGYWQPGYLSNQQLANIVADLTASGATLMTNSALTAFVAGKTNLPAGTNFFAWTPEGTALDFSLTYNSPVIGAGATLADIYENDLVGVNQNQAGIGPPWAIGARAYVPLLFGGVHP